MSLALLNQSLCTTFCFARAAALGLLVWLLLLMAAWHVVETVVATPGKLSACLSLAADPASLQERELPGWEQPKVSLQNLLPLPSDRLL